MLRLAWDRDTAVEPQARGPLRLALLVDDFTAPAWAAKLLQELKADAVAEIVLLIRVRDSQTTSAGGNRRASLLYRVYGALDERVFRARPDAFTSVDLASLVPDCPVIEVAVRRTGRVDTLDPNNIDAIRSHDLDIVLQLGSRSLDGGSGIARHGVWSYQNDAGDSVAEDAGVFWNVLQGNPVTTSLLAERGNGREGAVVLRRSFVATDKRSVRRNRNNLAWKAARLIVPAMRQLQEGSHIVEQSHPTSAPAEPKQPPGNGAMTKLLFGHAWRYVSDHLHTMRYNDSWVVYYHLGQGESRDIRSLAKPENYRPILPPKGRSYADPFCVQRGDDYFIFLEEFIDSLGKGVISVLAMNGAGRYTEPQCIIERDYHLSYPFIFSYKGEDYIVPESVEHRTVELYRCISWPDRWEPLDIMLRNIEAADSTIEKIDDTYWMFVSVPSAEGLRPCDELHLFYASTPLGPWKPHAANPVKCDVRSSRPAGRLFRHQGRLYRPAQDCSARYGYAISLNQVDRITRREYREHEVCRILPDWTAGLLATHTFNTAGRLTVVDGRIAQRK